MTKYRYDPELAPYVAMLPAVIDLSTQESIRHFWQTYTRSTRSNTPPVVDDVIWQDTVISSLDGQAIRLRIYRPAKQAGALLPAIVEIHGGGFVMGDLDMQDAWCHSLVRELHAVVVSIDYRLAPEHPFPAAHNDCYASLSWLFSQASSLGVDAHRIAIAGQSAGACLAVSTTLRARDQEGPKVCFQLLEVPVLDDRLQTVSMRAFSDTPFWNYPNAQWSWKHYLGPDHADNETSIPPCYAVPARADDLSCLPPTYISTMEFDPLRDEGIQFALRLMQAGVAVELHAFPGTFHGSSVLSKAAVSQRCHREVIDVLRKHLRSSTAD